MSDKKTEFRRLRQSYLEQMSGLAAMWNITNDECSMIAAEFLLHIFEQCGFSADEVDKNLKEMGRVYREQSVVTDG